MQFYVFEVSGGTNKGAALKLEIKIREFIELTEN